jgi:16S rRNA pseudouridine516 synthase
MCSDAMATLFHAPAMVRLDHLLARNLGCSRAEARRLISAGALTDAAGTPLADPRHPVSPLPFAARLEGAPQTLYDAVYLAQHKPAGILTALEDRRHPVAYTLLRDAPLHAELRPVGRLDLDTTGLLLWTTDGQWLHRLTHPKHAVPRTYQAALARPFRPPAGPLVLDDGHRPQIEALANLDQAALHPGLLRPADAVAYATITIIGGAYHEVRRIFAALGSHVLGLCRVQFGGLSLPNDLAPEGWALVRPDEVWAAAAPDARR